MKTERHVLRFDAEGTALLPVDADPNEPFLDCLDDRRVLVIDLERRLVILDVESGARTIVFPPPPES